MKTLLTSAFILIVFNLNAQRFIKDLNTVYPVDNPTSVAEDRWGNIYFSDNSDKVIKTDFSGNILDTLTGISDPVDIEVDDSGYVYVVDMSAGVVRLFNPDGSFNRNIGSFYKPLDMTIDNTGKLYVIDQRTDQIKKYSNEGTYLKSWDVPDPGDGYYFSPTNIESGKNGYLYVLPSSTSIQRYDTSGALINQWSLGSSESSIHSATTIGFNTHTQKLYALNKVAQNGIQQDYYFKVYNSSGGFLNNVTFSGGGTIYNGNDIAFNSQYMYISDWEYDKIKVFVTGQCARPGIDPVDDVTITTKDSITIKGAADSYFLPIAYEWTIDGEEVNTSDSLVIKEFTAGTYQGRLNISNRCGQTMESFTINILPPLGVNLKSNNQVLVYPNPATNYISIPSVNNSEVKIFSALGILMYDGIITGKIPVMNYPQGQYTILDSKGQLIAKFNKVL